MASIKAKVADAIISLHSYITDINDFREVPSMLETVIRKVFHIDWLGVFYFSEDFKSYNCVTNPFLPFDWNDKYQTISDIDIIRKNTFLLNMGEAYMHDTKRSPIDENELLLLETIKQYTDTSQFLVMQTGQGAGYKSGIGLYRTGKDQYFSEEDKVAFDCMSPVMVSISQMMKFYSHFGFKRAEIEEIQRARGPLTFLLNEFLKPVDLSPKTIRFFRQYFVDGGSGTIPERLDNWIKQDIAVGGKLRPNTGPWILKLPLVSFDLYCKAHIILTGMGQMGLFVQMIPHGAVPDFGVLGAIGLTQREIEALSYLPLGYTNQQIALAMDLQEVTVKKHLRSVGVKLGAQGRTEALFQAIQQKKLLESL